MNSTHKAEVITIDEVCIHPNADKLEIVKIFNGGYQSVVGKGQFTVGNKAIFIPPDSLVDTTRPEFSFLSSRAKGTDTFVKIRANKFRGVESYGLVINCPQEANIGDDYADKLNIRHYEPVEESKKNENMIGAPPGVWRKYDIDSLRRYNDIFQQNELVFVGEKINGENMRITYINEQVYVGSHNYWRKQLDNCGFWKAALLYPGVIEFCKDYPGYAVYGEKYGTVKHYKYGKTDVDFVCFDIMKPDGKYCNVEEWLNYCAKYEIPTVPTIVKSIEFDINKIDDWSSGLSLIPGSNHIREGCVIKPMIEGWDYTIGRKILKVVSFDYLNNK